MLISTQMRLHAVEPMQVPEGLKTIPRHWQLRGASKLLTMFDRWRGGILADEMGLGKTLTAIMVSESLDKQKFPGFTLVVTTKSCVHQWADELEQNFKPVSLSLARTWTTMTAHPGKDLLM